MTTQFHRWSYNRPMYVKKFPGLSPEDIVVLARHSQEISVALSDNAAVIVPRVIGCDSTSIIYSIVDCSSPISENLKTCSCTVRDLEKIGNILRKIHDNGLLHSDFVPHNIFRSDQNLVLIDSHPPEGIPCKHNLLYGDGRTEIIHFTFALLSNFGFKRAIRHFGYQRRMIGAFLTGYGKPGYPKICLLGSVLFNAREIFILKRRAKFSRMHAIAHCALGSILTCIVLGFSL